MLPTATLLKRPLRGRILLSVRSRSTRYAHREISIQSDASQIRLSSRLSIPVRLFYSGVYFALIALAASALFDPFPTDGIGRWPAVTAGALLLALAIGPWYLRLFAFRPTYLIGHDIVVRGFRATWRVPIEHVAQVTTRTPSGWVMVRISLDPRAPSVGAHIRVLGPFLKDSGYVESVLETMRNARRAGA